MPKRQFAVIDFNSSGNDRNFNNMKMNFKLADGELLRDPRTDESFKLSVWPEKIAAYSTRELNFNEYSNQSNPTLHPYKRRSKYDIPESDLINLQHSQSRSLSRRRTRRYPPIEEMIDLSQSQRQSPNINIVSNLPPSSISPSLSSSSSSPISSILPSPVFTAPSLIDDDQRNNITPSEKMSISFLVN